VLRTTVLATAGLLLLGWPATPPATAADRLTVSATNPTAFEWDLLTARDQGFFARENLEVQVSYMTPPLVIQALIAGQVQIAKSGTHFGVMAAARGAELRIVAAGLYGYPYDLISRPEVTSLADLKGQKIAAASLASITTVIFKDIMARRGIPPSEYTLLFVGGSPERYQTLLSGQVAASLAESPPFNYRALDAGHRVLLRYNDLIKNLQYLSYFVAPKWAAGNRPLLARFLRAVVRAQRWLNDPANEGQAVRGLVQHLRIDERTASQTYRHMIVEGKAYRGEAAIDGAGLAEVVRMLAEYDLIPRQEPWESFADPSHLEGIRTAD
jgi:ABC-type nitrate/sulfonate/bicarbonate transport system substrate-binding protein